MAVIAVVVDAVLPGVNVTLTVHCAPPAAKAPLHVLDDTANSLSEVEKPLRVMGALPTLVKVTVSGELAVASAWLPKLRVCGFSDKAGVFAGLTLAMKPLPDDPEPEYVPWKTPPVAGKLFDVVVPAT